MTAPTWSPLLQRRIATEGEHSDASSWASENYAGGSADPDSSSEYEPSTTFAGSAIGSPLRTDEGRCSGQDNDQHATKHPDQPKPKLPDGLTPTAIRQAKLMALEDSGKPFSLTEKAQEHLKATGRISDKQLRRDQAEALVQSAHAVTAISNVQPPPAAIGSRLPRAARRNKFRKWNVAMDGDLGFRHCVGGTERCDCASSASLEPAPSSGPIAFQDSVLQFQDPTRGSLCPLWDSRRRVI